MLWSLISVNYGDSEQERVIKVVKKVFARAWDVSNRDNVKRRRERVWVSLVGCSGGL